MRFERETDDGYWCLQLDPWLERGIGLAIFVLITGGKVSEIVSAGAWPWP